MAAFIAARIIMGSSTGGGGGYVPTCVHCGKPYPLGKLEQPYDHDWWVIPLIVVSGIGFVMWGTFTLVDWAESPTATLVQVLGNQWLFLKALAGRIW